MGAPFILAGTGLIGAQPHPAVRTSHRADVLYAAGCRSDASQIVADEAIFLAIIGALLAAGVQSELHVALTGRVGQVRLDDAGIRSLATQMASGNLDRAAAVVPQIDPALLLHVHAEAFRATLCVLAALTVAAASMSFILLRRASGVPLADIEAPAVVDAAARTGKA
jgi:hypothetical protein